MTRQEAYDFVRLRTGEKVSKVVPDRMLDSYIQGGLEATQDALEYFLVDDTTALTLVAEQQDYTMPVGAGRIIFIEWNGRFLTKTSMEELRKRGDNWRQLPSDQPSQYLLWGRTLSLVPKPSAAAVTAAATGTIRHVGTPTDFRTTGFAQLATQHHRIPLYWAISEWYAAINKDQASAQRFLSLFQARAQTAAAFYRGRETG